MKKQFLLLMIIPLITSCAPSYKPDIPRHIPLGVINDQGKYIDPLYTVVSLKMYNEDQLKSVRQKFDDSIITSHMYLDSSSTYNRFTNIKNINDSINSGEPIKVNPYVIDVIEKGINLTKLSDGLFNITMGQVIDLYSPLFKEYDKDLYPHGKDQFNTNYDPMDYELDNALTSIIAPNELDNYIKIDKANSEITFTAPNSSKVLPKIDLGGMSKGYALDSVSSLFEAGVPAIINLGSSSISLKGDFPLKKRSNYTVILKEPSYKVKQTMEEFVTLSLEGDTNISHSGDYEQFYISKSTQRYNSHIIDPLTGKSSNYHQSAICFGKGPNYMLDVLSTVLMNIKDFADIKKMVSKFETTFETKISYAIFDGTFEEGYNLTCNQSFNDHLVKNKMSSKVNNVITL